MSLGQLFFGFHGRIRRLQFWGASLPVWVVFLLLLFAIRVWFPVGPNDHMDPVAITLILMTYFLALWTNLAIQAKRWHDRDKSSWWLLINLLPIVGGIWALVENGFLDGTQGPNEFGPSPKGIGEIAAPDGSTAILGGDASLPDSDDGAEPPAFSAGWTMTVLACVALAGALFIGFERFAANDPEATAPESPKPRALGQDSTLGAPNTSLEVPALRGRVNDYAHLLTPDQETELSTLYESLEQEIGCQIVLLTIDALHGVGIEDYSQKVANTWGLGRRGIDDGVLITLAHEDRMVRVEVGSGLESVLPDDAAARIVQNMVPEFTKDDFFKGLREGSLEIVQMIHANQDLVGKRKP